MRPFAASLTLAVTLVSSGLVFEQSLAYAQEKQTLVSLEFSERELAQIQFDWAMQCQGCHNTNGEGQENRDVPSLKGEVSKFLSVEGGREFLVQVPGVSGAPIDDQRLADLINWMLITMDPGNLTSDWKIYTADEVGFERTNPIRTDVFERRAELIANITEYLESTK